MTIYCNNFKPTYLYIKQHSITGKLYFGKTIKNPEKYNGSGLHWSRHIKKYGKEHVITLWYCLFYGQEECTKFALMFSEQHNIVESDDWLNLKKENGNDGGNDKGVGLGRVMPQSTKIKIRDALKGIPLSHEHIRKIVKGRTGITASKAARIANGLAHRKYIYITPYGKFNTSFEGASALNISHCTLIRICNNRNLNIITNRTFSSLCKKFDFPKCWIGKTWNDVGFSIEILI